MDNRIKKCCINGVLIVLSLCLCLQIKVNAQEVAAPISLTPYNTSLSFNMEERNQCSGHDFFYQVSVREDGCFAVCYRQASNSIQAKQTFGVAYIDIFDANSHFQKELVIQTDQDFAMEYILDNVNLYFFDYMISYDLLSGNIDCYAYPKGWAIESGKDESLRKMSFTLGEWRYSCQRSFHGYTKLVRENSHEQQVLLALPGSSLNLYKTVLPAAICAIVIFSLRKLKSKT